MTKIPALKKAFPVMLDLRTEAGLKHSLHVLRQFFPNGYIPVVCPDCGTKNNITMDSIEKHAFIRNPPGPQNPIEFDECVKCGRNLVFESPMGPKRKPVPEKSPKSRAEHIEQLNEKVGVEEPPKRWNAKTEAWEVVTK